MQSLPSRFAQSFTQAYNLRKLHAVNVKSGQHRHAYHNLVVMSVRSTLNYTYCFGYSLQATLSDTISDTRATVNPLPFIRWIDELSANAQVERMGFEPMIYSLKDCRLRPLVKRSTLPVSCAYRLHRTQITSHDQRGNTNNKDACPAREQSSTQDLNL